MTTQTELFPKTHEEIAQALLTYFEDEVEKRTKAMFSAQAKLAEVLDLREMAEQEVKRHAGKSVLETTADIINSGALDTDGLTVTASVSPAVDPVTGEVTAAPEPNVSVVVVLYPGSDEPVVTKIGAHTRYGELVADYFTAAGLNGKRDAKDWLVLAEDELTTTGGLRKLRDVIVGSDYGRRLIVAAAGQGFVTGSAAVAQEPAP